MLLYYVLTLTWIALCAIETLTGQFLWTAVGLLWIYRAVQLHPLLRDLMRALESGSVPRALPRSMELRLAADVALNLAFVIAILVSLSIQSH